MKKFTKYHSLSDILAYPRMAEYLHVFYSEYLLEMFPKDFYKEPLALAEHYGETPWEEPFSMIVDQLVDAANLILDICENKKRRCVSLWNPQDGDWTLDKEKLGGKNQVFLLSPMNNDKKKESSQEVKPAAIICPGGGYEAVCFSGEGTPVMHYMEVNGYCTFILKYRVAPERYPAPQEDLALAIQYVRSHAAEYGIDPNDILLIGASAGGHLCASEAALHEEAARLANEELEKTAPEVAGRYRQFSARPDKVCLNYPVISFQKEPHEGSFQNLTGGTEYLRKELSAENLVDASYPPTFVWTCADDDCVPPSNAAVMGAALEKSGIPHELHIYPAGGHGCGLAFSKPAYEWPRTMLKFIKKNSFDIQRDSFPHTF